MSKPVNKTLIGIFVVVAMSLMITAVLILGSGKFFKHNPKFVMYFQGSVQGLAVGSPVNFRGVQLGRVIAIKMFFNPQNLAIMIPVYVELEEGSLKTVPGSQSMNAREKLPSLENFAQELIKSGLKAQLEMQSLVTGQLMVSLDFHPDKPATLVSADRRYPEIPTIPTSLQELSARMAKVPLEEIFEKLNATMSGIEKIVNTPETAGTIKAIRQAAAETRSLVQTIAQQVKPLAARMTDVATEVQKLTGRLESQIVPMAAQLHHTADETGRTLKKAQATLGSIEDVASPDGLLAPRLAKTLDDLGAAARSLRLLADTMQQQPDAIIFGKKNRRGK
jgi:paraquat-inducible protein B